MMSQEFARLLARYGQSVCLHFPDGTTQEGRCFLEAVLDRREEWEQELPTTLGMMRQDRFVYLGAPELGLDEVGQGYLTCQGRQFTVQTAQAVYVGEERSHWWGILRLREVNS